MMSGRSALELSQRMRDGAKDLPVQDCYSKGSSSTLQNRFVDTNPDNMTVRMRIQILLTKLYRFHFGRIRNFYKKFRHPIPHLRIGIKFYESRIYCHTDPRLCPSGWV